MIALLILSPAAGAQTIYTCRPASGPTSYQTQPCATAHTQVKAKLYPYIRNPTPPAPARQPWRPTTSGYQSTSAYTPSSATATARPTDRTLQRQQCAQTKDARTQAFEAAGLNRSFDLSRQWDDAVYQACKGL